MKRKLLISFLLLAAMIFVMRYQGTSLVTPASPAGIIDLEFAKTAEKFLQLRLFLDPAATTTNLYLDFLFIAAYAWFFMTACMFVQERTSWVKWSKTFYSIALSAAFFDVCENFLLLLVLGGRFNPSVLQIVFYCALIKFIFVGGVVLFLLVSFPFALKRRHGV